MSPLPKFLSRDEVRQIDSTAIERYGMSGLVLMENAGRGAAETIAPLLNGRRAILLCGKGNNAGDGYVIARHLQLLGCEAEIFQLSDPGELRGDALVNWQIAEHAELLRRVVSEELRQSAWAELAAAEVIVDAMVGTGASGALREPFAAASEAANASSALRIAIDLPSGIDCDSGQTSGVCFAADHTITFVAAKQGFERPQAKRWIGQVTVVSIGVPLRLLQSVRQQ